MEQTSEEELDNESDIFGSVTTIDSTSSDSDFENKLKNLTKRRTHRKLSSKTDTHIDQEPPSPLEDGVGIEEDQEITEDNGLVEESKEVQEEEVKVAKYRKRTLSADEELLEQFLYSGLDREDLLMIRLAFLRMKADDSDIIMDISWSYYPPDILQYTIYTVHTV